MINYIIRRLLYAIPTLIGVNLIVFFLFFFVNTPDDMARLNSGKNPTPDKIDTWKREHQLDLPYFYNQGWARVGAIFQKPGAKEIKGAFPTEAGRFALVIQVPELKPIKPKILGPDTKAEPPSPAAIAAAEGQEVSVTLTFKEKDKLVLPDDFVDGTVTLPKGAKTQRFEFEIKEGAAKVDGLGAPLTVEMKLEQPTPLFQAVVEYQKPMDFGSSVTQTIFWQRSVKTLFLAFGKSDSGKDIRDEISKRVGPTLSIAVPALFFAVIVNIVFAMVLAFYRGTYLDYWGVVICVVLMSIAYLFYIMGGQILVGKMLRLAPISGYDPEGMPLKYVLLPVIIMVVSDIGGSVRFYRTIFLEEVSKDYVRTARAKGLSERSVLFIHALKNAMIPILTGLVVALPALILGSLITESYFAIPGMGSLTVDGLRSQDFAITQSMVMMGSMLYIVGLILTDISYTLVDPRVRLG